MSNAYGGAQQSKGLSITALVLGILSILFGILTAVPGIIVGHIARSKAKKNPEHYGGSGMALTGLILSYAVIILSVAAIYFFVTNPEMQELFKDAMEQAKQQQLQQPQ